MKMRSVPLSYVMRNLWVRRFTTILTAGGMALVVFVFAAVLMMSEGINQTLVSTGQPDNVMVLRKGAGSEINSVITREQARAIDSVPGVATDSLGRKLVSKEPVVLNNLPKLGTGSLSNVPVRGTSELGMRLRPQIRIVQGTMFHEGTSELIIGQAVARGFENMGLGQTLHFAGRDWVIVGIFDAGRSGFDSEIWGDSDQVMQAYHRAVYSSVIFKLSDADSFPAARDTIANDPRLNLDVKREQQFYAEQSESMSKFIRLLGLSLSVIFSIGAIIGAMITMFAAVASRIGEIGTLRALGFRREAILICFLGESMGFSIVGGLVGLGCASFMQAINISTLNFQTFSEIAFRFQLTPLIALQTMAFALFMGVTGGLIPAWRAAQLSIVECLREA